MTENDNGGFNKKFMVSVIVMTIIIGILSIIASIYAYELDPGQTMSVFCDNCTVLDTEPTTHINASVDFMCIADADAPIAGNCTIHKDMEGGELISNSEGACDINVSCDAASCGRFQDVGYNGKLAISKGNLTSSINMNLTIKNYKDQDFFSYSRTIDPDEIITAEYPINFECPHEVITEVSMQTCSDYLDPILGENNPLIYALATAQNNCTVQLTQCSADALSIRNDLKDCEVDLSTCEDNNEDVIAQQMREKDDHVAEINRRNADDITYKQNTVGIGWMYIAITLAIIMVLYMLGMFFSGGGEE